MDLSLLLYNVIFYTNRNEVLYTSPIVSFVVPHEKEPSSIWATDLRWAGVYPTDPFEMQQWRPYLHIKTPSELQATAAAPSNFDRDCLHLPLDSLTLPHSQQSKKPIVQIHHPPSKAHHATHNPPLPGTPNCPAIGPSSVCARR